MAATGCNSSRASTSVLTITLGRWFACSAPSAWRVPADEVVSIFGNIIIDGTVNGDVVTVGGGIKLGEDANIGGDAVAMGRGLYRHPNAVVKGETVSQSGPIILLGLIIVPLLPIILVVALIVWLLRRNRYSAPAPGCVPPVAEGLADCRPRVQNLDTRLRELWRCSSLAKLLDCESRHTYMCTASQQSCF